MISLPELFFLQLIIALKIKKIKKKKLLPTLQVMRSTIP